MGFFREVRKGSTSPVVILVRPTERISDTRTVFTLFLARTGLTEAHLAPTGACILQPTSSKVGCISNIWGSFDFDHPTIVALLLSNYDPAPVVFDVAISTAAAE